VRRGGPRSDLYITLSETKEELLSGATVAAMALAPMVPDAVNALQSFARLVCATIRLELTKQSFQFAYLSLDFRQRRLRRIADPHLLCNQPVQLFLLPPKRVDDVYPIFWHARTDAVLAARSIDPAKAPTTACRLLRLVLKQFCRSAELFREFRHCLFRVKIFGLFREN
jgi:hypothetical protein